MLVSPAESHENITVPMTAQTPPTIARIIDPLLRSPLFNFASILLTIASILILVIPSLLEVSLSAKEVLHRIDRLILLVFLIEMFLRLIGTRRRRYFLNLPFWIDCIVVLPLLSEWALYLLLETGNISPETAGFAMDFPGLYLIEGVRSLRLLQSVQYFYLQRQFGLTGERLMSSIKARIFAGVSTLLFFIILAAGIAVSVVLHNLTETQKQNRLQQVRVQAQSYGVLQARLLFHSVMAVTITTPDSKRLIRNEQFSPEHVKEHFRYGEDYIQLDGVRPGESVQISFYDLNRRRDSVELATLVTGILVVVALLISLNHYLDALILDPVERAHRVTELRLNGEELETTEIRQIPFTEITLLINGVDLLYQKMRARARKQITHQGRTDDGTRQPPAI